MEDKWENDERKMTEIFKSIKIHENQIVKTYNNNPDIDMEKRR